MVSLIIIFVRIEVLSVDVFLSSRHVAISHQSISLLSLPIEVFFVLLPCLSLVLNLLLLQLILCGLNALLLSLLDFLQVLFILLLGKFFLNDLPFDVFQISLTYFRGLLLQVVCSCVNPVNPEGISFF